MHNEYHVILECMIIFYQTSMRRFSIRFVTCFWRRFWRQKSFCYASSLMGGGGGGGAIGIVCVRVGGGGGGLHGGVVDGLTTRHVSHIEIRLL